MVDVEDIEVLVISAQRKGKGMMFPKVFDNIPVPLLCYFSIHPCSEIYVLKTYDLIWSQGGWEKDECIEDAAARETVEEAGVVGDLEVANSLPNYYFHLSHILVDHFFRYKLLQRESCETISILIFKF